MVSIDIPIKDKKNPPALKFPDRCANCGKPNETTLGITLQMGVQKRGQSVAMDLKVQMCNVCADMERKIAQVTLIPFLIAGVCTGFSVFLPVVFIAPEGTSTQTLALPWVIASAVGLIAGLIGGTTVEIISKIESVRVYGKMVMRRPLTIFSVFSESDDIVGLSVKFSRETNIVHLAFENDEIAREFKKINSLERS